MDAELASKLMATLRFAQSVVSSAAEEAGFKQRALSHAALSQSGRCLALLLSELYGPQSKLLPRANPGLEQPLEQFIQLLGARFAKSGSDSELDHVNPFSQLVATTPRWFAFLLLVSASTEFTPKAWVEYLEGHITKLKRLISGSNVTPIDAASKPLQVIASSNEAPSAAELEFLLSCLSEPSICLHWSRLDLESLNQALVDAQAYLKSALDQQAEY